MIHSCAASQAWHLTHGTGTSTYSLCGELGADLGDQIGGGVGGVVRQGAGKKQRQREVGGEIGKVGLKESVNCRDGDLLG